jgi:hypothetical protein
MLYATTHNIANNGFSGYSSNVALHIISCRRTICFIKTEKEK